MPARGGGSLSPPPPARAETIGFRYPHQVSGGQLQRAMTAMAMSCRPDLIVFDEPTTALDVTTQIEVLAAIKDIVRQFDTAAIYITHDLAVVAQMADRIMVLRYGEVVEERPPARCSRARKRPTRSRCGRALPAQGRVARRRHAAARRSRRRRLRRRAHGAEGREHRGSARPHRRRGRESGSGKSTLARVITGLLPPLKARSSTTASRCRRR